jgi:hypothetical protein
MAQTATLLELNEDGIAWMSNKAVYRVPAGHLPRMKDWTGTEIIIERSDNAAWQYVLKSAATPQQWVHATPSSGVWKW